MQLSHLKFPLSVALSLLLLTLKNNISSQTILAMFQTTTFYQHQNNNITEVTELIVT